jgi:hypothetical protein
MSFPTLANTPMVCALGRGNRSKSVECVCGASTARTAAGYFGVMRGLKARSRIGLAFMALLLTGCANGCSEDIMTSRWRFSEGSSENICQQFIDVRLERDISNQFVSIDLELKIWVDSPTRSIAVDHSSEYVKTDSTSGYFELTVGDTLPSDVVRSGSNVLRAIVFESSSEVAENALSSGSIFVSDCDEEPEMSSSAAPEPAPEPDSDVEQPVSDLKAVFHFANSADTFGCPFMQVVDVAGVADNADVSLKFSIDGTPVEHTAEFITEDEYVQEGFDGYFDLVAGDNFNATLEGEHTLKVEVSDGVGSVTIQGKFTADSCPPN